MSELALPRLFAAHRRLVWSLCYRMTGSAADADDLVQDTFLRALERPPADAARDPRPWLVRVAVNLSRDHLRARQRRGYTGPFLASPIDTSHLPADAAQRPDSYYGALESLSFAFLAALEVLTPRQRAVLILCDVMGYAVRETAAALDMSEANVKTTHHRARLAMSSYDGKRQPITRALQARTMRRLRAFMIHALHSDGRELAKLLAADVTEWNDGAGEFFAARAPVRGVEKVILFTRKTQRTGAFRAALRQLNGLPALVIDFGHASQLRSRPASAGIDPKVPPRSVVSLQLDASGAIRDIYGVVASRKLTHVGFERLHTAPVFMGQLAAGCFEPELAASLVRVLGRRLRSAVAQRQSAPPLVTDAPAHNPD
jgi:RNA polymerase sigma factor (sigma-70 family)